MFHHDGNHVHNSIRRGSSVLSFTLPMEKTLSNGAAATSIHTDKKPRAFTKLERVLLTLTVFLSVLSSIIFVLLVYAATEPLISRTLFPSAFFPEFATPDRRFGGIRRNDSTRKYCLTEPCVAAAASILKSMDSNVNPCEDFYQFACGRWTHSHVLPPDKPSYDTFSSMKDELRVRLKELLEAPIEDSDTNATANAKNLYASCTNETTIERLREGPLLDLLSKFTSWPVMNSSWDGEDFDWVDIVAQLRLHRLNVLFAMWVGADHKNSTRHVIQIDQVDPGIPTSDASTQRGQTQLQSYLNYMLEVAELLGANKSEARNQLKQVVHFELKLQNFTESNELRRNFSAIYRKMSLSELHTFIPQIDWPRYLRKVFPIDIPFTEHIVVYAPSYLRKMAQLVAETPKRTLANYLIWRLIFHQVANLDRRFVARQQRYFSVLYGIQATPVRWKLCVQFVNKHLGMAVGRLFVLKYFNHDSKIIANEMISDIKSSFLEMLDTVDWMDDDTRAVAREKALLMEERIGYPDYILKPHEIDQQLQVFFERNTYFENIIKNLQYRANQEFHQLRKPVDKNKWNTVPTTVNAFYTRSKNLMTYPAGVLQPPIFHSDYPRSINYGGIGVVIGHEITHGFDDRGRQFDQHGNLRQWWDSETLTKFKSKAQCMIDQYGGYRLASINKNLNGVNTQGENIADNGGIKQAFRAYRKREEISSPEPFLPGVNLTHDQLFFLTYAQIWCGSSTREHLSNSIRTSDHSPPRYRVIGVISNSKEFSKAFGCPLGSPMNPVHKCEVW